MLANLLRRITSTPRVFVLTLLALVSTVPALTVADAQSGLVISQIYGGGGNTGATYMNDFIEIFNGTGSTISLVGYSVQYASSTGTSWQVTQLGTNGGIQNLPAGAYYLIQEAAGTGGTQSLPTPDQIGAIAISATAGKVALSRSTTALTGACPSTDTNAIDIVSFGAAATSCFGTPTPTLTNTTSAIRKVSCTNTKNNSADFTTATSGPAPSTPARNTSTTFTPCPSTGGTTTIGVSGLASPAAINNGDTTLLTAAITPTTASPSATISVTVDLSAIGGSKTQALLDDGKNGDSVAGDNTFSYSTAVNTNGTFSFPVTATDTALHSGNGSIALTVTPPPSAIAIHDINGTGTTSPYVGSTVSTTGVVTGILSNGFYMQLPDAQVDADPNTPEGIFVFRGSTVLPSYIVVGNQVRVSGTVATYSATPSYTPQTELTNPTFSLISSGNALPTPVVIAAPQDSPNGGIAQFHKYMGMRVTIGSLTTTEGTDANLVESTETNTSNGQFWGVVTGVARPFREPGISVNDATYTTAIPATVPRFDNNPELLFLDSKALGGTAIDVTAQATLTNVAGIVDFSNGYADILIDPTNRPTVSGLIQPQGVPVPAVNEFTIASFNMERFYTSDSTAAKNPGSSVVVVTPAAYQRRLQKASIAVRNFLNFPDIVGAQEIQDLQVLTDLSNKISADATAAGQSDPAYSPYLFLATDGTGINTGFLVKSGRVTTLKVEQFGLNTTFTNSTGAQATLNDRTPLVLHAGIKRTGGVDYPITVIDVHQRSLNGVDDPSNTGQTVRLKREAQAEYLANLIQSYQSAGEHVVTVGDFNSFQFSDGFADVIGVTKGNPVPANQVVVAPMANLVNPNLVDLVTTLPAAQQQSYTFNGNAQVLDHVLITQDLQPLVTRFAQAHFDADFPLVNLNDANSPSRVSDHDPAVAYFAIPPIPGTVTLGVKTAITKLANGSYQVVYTVTNTGAGTAQAVQLTSATLGSATGTPTPQSFGDIAPNGGTATVTFTFPSTAGNSGSAAVDRYAGTYNGGSFGGSIRSTLP